MEVQTPLELAQTWRAVISRVSPWRVKLIRQRDTGALAGMPIGVYGDLDARMPQLLGHVLDGGMILIELDGRIAVPKIMDAIDVQACQGTHASMDRIQPR